MEEVRWDSSMEGTVTRKRWPSAASRRTLAKRLDISEKAIPSLVERQHLPPSSKSARLGRPILKGLAEMDSDDRRCRWAKLKLGLLHE